MSARDRWLKQSWAKAYPGINGSNEIGATAWGLCGHIVCGDDPIDLTYSQNAALG